MYRYSQISKGSCWARPDSQGCNERDIDQISDQQSGIWGEGQPKLEEGQRIYMNKSDDYKWYTAADGEIEINPVCYLCKLRAKKSSKIFIL